MDKIIEIEDIIVFKKACKILELLDKNYDKKELMKRIDICKELVALFEEDLEYLEEKKANRT